MKGKKLLCYLLVLSMITGLCPVTVMATTSEETRESNVIYSDAETVRFEGKEPVYAETDGKNALKITRTEKPEEALSVTVQVYDNSANYGEDYILKYDGNEIPMIEGATSIYDAFRDHGELTSNLPVNAAEKIVTYSENTQAEGSVDASDMLEQIRELGAMAAEFEVAFESGETEKELMIEVLDDELSEYDESIMITLLDSEGQVYEDGQIMATIIDDEEEPSVHVAFDCEETILVKDDTQKAQITFKRTGNLATGTNAVLNFDGKPMGYVDFAPYQDTQVVLAVEGNYTLSSDGNYTVSDDTVVVQMEEKNLPEGADPVLDAVPDEYAEIKPLRKDSPANWAPEWANKTGVIEEKDSIIVMGSANECLFEQDDSSTDGSFTFDPEKNEGILSTSGGEKEGIVYARTKKTYDLTGIESVEGVMYVKEMDVGCGDVIFGVWNTGHVKIYNKDNGSMQELVHTLDDHYQGSRYIYYANKDLEGIWDQGWVGYIPNGFKMNKRTYKIRLENAEPLSFTKGSYAPTLTGESTMYYMVGNNNQINFSYTTDSGYPVELVGFEFKDNKNNESEVYSLNGQGSLTFDQEFLKKYEKSWCYKDADGYATFTIRPVFAKIGVNYEINQTDAGTIEIVSPEDKNLYKGDTVVFTGEGTGGATLSGVAYQCRQSAGGDIQDWGFKGAMDGENGPEVSIDIDTAKWGHYTFEGVFNAGANQLIVNYASEESKKNGVLKTEGLVVDKDIYDISNYFPLIADANDGYVTEWNVNGKKFYGDTFNYQLTGMPSDNTVTVDFVKESSLSMEKGTISGYITRANENLLNGVSSDVMLTNTEYVVLTSHDERVKDENGQIEYEHSGKTDENGYFEIENFYGVVGGTYSIAANYQNRTGYITFVYNGTEKQTLRFPQYPAGGFYPVEVIATVDGVGYRSNYIYLTSAGRVELMADIYVHSDEYEITDVTFHFLSNLKDNYGDKLKEYKAIYDPDTNLGAKHQVWRLELNDTTALPKDSHMYITVTANYPYTYKEGNVTKTDYTSFTTDLVDTGYNLAEPLKEDVTMIQQDIPEVPGLQNSEDDTALLDIPVIGTLDMSVTSSTGGYFVQKGSWKEDGDVYTLVCGHSTQPVFGVGTVKDRYDGAKKTRDLLDSASSGDPQGIADLKQKQAATIDIYPVYYLKFTIQTQAEPTADDPDNLEHYVIGYELALGIDAFIRKNIPFMAGPVPVYIFIAINSEAYVQLQSAMPPVPMGEDISRYYLDEAETNIFFNAPKMEFGLKGGMGWNFWASVFAEGYIRVPFIIEFTPFDMAGNVDFDIGIGVEMVGFAFEVEYRPDAPYSYGNTELLDELKTISDQQSDTDPVQGSYRMSNGQRYETLDEALQNATFTAIERPVRGQSVLRAGEISNEKLAEGVFMNTDVQLMKLKNGNIMAFFLTDNQAEERSFNYLSAAYAISKDNGKTWSQVEYINENISEETSSYQYDIKAFELDDYIMVTWSEADVDEILKGVDKDNISAAKIRDIMAAMNLKGRFFDKETGEAIGDTMLIAGNTTVFCGGLEAVQNGDKVYVYYQRNVFPEGEDITAEDLLASERTIALASTDIHNPGEWNCVPVRATNGEEEYRVVDVVPFTNNDIMGEILVLDRNGKLAYYDETTQEMKPDIEDWQLYLRTYEFNEGNPEATALKAITDQDVCAKSPEVVRHDGKLYLFWNQDGNIVYTSDILGSEEGYEAGAATIASDETLHIGTEFTASISEDGNILLSWVASDEKDETLVPTDEIYGMMVEAGEDGLKALGSPIALTDGDRPIGAVDSVTMKSGEGEKFLLAYTQLNEMLRRESTSADILTQVNEEKAKLEIEVDAPEYPVPGNTMTADVTIRNEGFEALNGYELTISGVGETVTLTKEVIINQEEGKDNHAILPGRKTTIPVEIEVPEDFDETTMLKVEVQGLGNQNVYKASTEKEVFYDSYMVPMDIPEVESVPNSTDCLVTLKVRNEGNASGNVMMNLTNQVYGSTDKKDIKEYQHISEEMIMPGSEATITYLMKETFMNEEVYSTVEVWTGEGHDQGTEAPMTEPVTIEAEDVASENGDAEKPDTPETPDEPDDSEEDEKLENPFAGFVNAIKQIMQGFAKAIKKACCFWENLFK